MNTRPRTFRLRTGLILTALLSLVLAACSPAPAEPATPRPAAGRPPAAVCGNTLPGPAAAPAGAVTVDPAVDGDLAEKTRTNPPGTTLWLAPGTHTLGRDQYGQVTPKDGNTYLGTPGAILDGRGGNLYAFVGEATDVTIRYLTVQGFVAPRDQGNRGAALMAGARQQVRGNCLRNNGQYGMNAYQAGNTITGLVVVGNEIAGNNTDDWETRSPGCGCTGGIKFWSVDGAVVRDNWIHDNNGVGLWVDTNNNDFLIEGNDIEDNDSIAIFYETSYNAVIRDNVIRGNTLVGGKEFADRGDNFPVAAIYISESGGEPRIPARTDRIEIYGNVLQNNWSGITLWENADRFCNSPANTSATCTLLVPTAQLCSQPGIATEPRYSDCRWKTQCVDIHDNTFVYDPAVVGCEPGLTGRMAMLSNYGTYPDWSPYGGTVIQEAITFAQRNRWHDNDYVGPWMFTAYDTGRLLGEARWRAAPYRQDNGSTFTGARDRGC